jgi:prolyl-tRNA synthetase
VAGLYTWLPRLRVLRRIEAIIREELVQRCTGAAHAVRAAGGLWQESIAGTPWPRHASHEGSVRRDFCLGPTHKKNTTDIVRNEIRATSSCPATCTVNLKFREIRPRSAMRARETS